MLLCYIKWTIWEDFGITFLYLRYRKFLINIYEKGLLKRQENIT